MILRILLVFALLAGAPAYAKTFKIATISPDGLAWMKKLRAGTREIEHRTDGRVKFKIYPGGVQGDDFTVLRKMRIGQLQGGAVAASTLTRFYPDLQIYNLPLKFWRLDEVDYVRARMDQRIIDGLDRAGIVSFTLAETGFAYVMSTKPVRSLDELRNMKAWVPDGDPISAQLIQSFGISPIPLYVSDVLAGLQTGLIDAVAVPPIVALALQWHTQLKYMINVPLVYIYSMMMLDKKAFESISPEDQAVVRTVLDRVFREIDQDNRKDSRAAYKALVEQGIEVIQFDAEQMVDWRERAEASIEDLVEADQISRESLQLLNRYLVESRRDGGAQQSTSSD